MLRFIDLFHATVVTLLVAAPLACEVGYKELEPDSGGEATGAETGAGQDLACLLGTELQTVGTAQTSKAEVCAQVECDVGWGVSAEPFDIQWTTTLTELDPAIVSGMGVHEGVLHLAVSSWPDTSVFVVRVSAGTGEELSRTKVPFASPVYGWDVAQATDAYFLNHDLVDGQSGVSRIGLDAQLQWTREFGPDSGGFDIGASGERLAILDASMGPQRTVELANLEGETLWTVPGPDDAHIIEIVEDGVVVLSDEVLTIYELEDGSLRLTAPMDESSSVNAVAGSGDALTLVGWRDGGPREDGLVTRLLGGEQAWSRTYNRMLESCDVLYPGEGPGSSEFFVAALALADQRTLVLGHDRLTEFDAFWGQAWVGLVDAEGELERVDWIHDVSGFATDAVEGPDGTLYMIGVSDELGFVGNARNVLVRAYGL